MTQFPIDRAFLVGVWVETLLYGLYTPLFIICVYVLIRKRHQSSIDVPMLAAAFAMYGFATLHVLCGLVRILQAFIDQPTQQGTWIYLNTLGLPINIMMETLSVVNSAIGDCVIIYRCYIVWGRNIWIVIVPIILLVCIAGTALYGVAELTRVGFGSTVFANTISRIATAVFSSTLAWQIIVSSLIAGRLLWMARRSSKIWGHEHSRFYISIVRLVIESAAIYSVTLAVFLVLYLLKNNAEKIVFLCLVQISAIAPTLIIVRVGLRLYEHSEEHVSTAQTKASTRPVMFAQQPQPVSQPTPRPSASMHVSMTDSDADEYEFVRTSDHMRTTDLQRNDSERAMGIAV